MTLSDAADDFFLRLLEVADRAVIGRTRDDRAPFVRQMQVPSGSGCPAECEPLGAVLAGGQLA
jgi:hypothetical protein